MGRSFRSPRERVARSAQRFAPPAACGRSRVSAERGRSSRWGRGARLTRRAREEPPPGELARVYFDRSATMSRAERGSSAGMHRRSLPERGASTAETPERKGRGTGPLDPHPCSGTPRDSVYKPLAGWESARHPGNTAGSVVFSLLARYGALCPWAVNSLWWSPGERRERPVLPVGARRPADKAREGGIPSVFRPKRNAGRRKAARFRRDGSPLERRVGFTTGC